MLEKRQGLFLRPLVTKGRLVKKVTGKPASVKFNGEWTLKREEKKGDVIGFWHTHPDGNLEPSERDIKTMKAWISCFGKPLFCVIQNSSREAAYLVVPAEHEKWDTIWSKKLYVYKIFRRYGVCK